MTQMQKKCKYTKNFKQIPIRLEDSEDAFNVFRELFEKNVLYFSLVGFNFVLTMVDMIMSFLLFVVPELLQHIRIVSVACLNLQQVKNTTDDKHRGDNIM